MKSANILLIYVLDFGEQMVATLLYLISSN